MESVIPFAGGETPAPLLLQLKREARAKYQNKGLKTPLDMITPVGIYVHVCIRLEVTIGNIYLINTLLLTQSYVCEGLQVYIVTIYVYSFCRWKNVWT